MMAWSSPARPASGSRRLYQEPAKRGLASAGANYDDGGCSGANLERPALKRLMADTRAGKVQIVVVYKVDRLTRSPTNVKEAEQRGGGKS